MALYKRRGVQVVTRRFFHTGTDAVCEELLRVKLETWARLPALLFALVGGRGRDEPRLPGDGDHTRQP
ncbi:hypothetical protein JOB18_012752 [Solea senegalensis]|uniref:Uncharacterized protein n=1 Tax=Solea senegalensis TaxID=28829 RepID=A0AAV6R2L2_SOLSE|nr:hypothetical protein JOB18_012752 [Solea senegalensis]